MADLDQKRAGGVAALVQQGLRLVGHAGQQRRIAVVARDAKGVTGGFGAGQRAACAVEEVAAGAWQFGGLGRLPPGAGRVGGITAHPVHPRQNDRCQHRQRAAQRRKPP